MKHEYRKTENGLEIVQVYEPGDKKPIQFGDYKCLKSDPTTEDYSELVLGVLKLVMQTINETGIKYELEDAAFIHKNTPSGDPLLMLKATLSHIVQEGESE